MKRRYLKRPFPEYNPCAITRTNIEIAMVRDPSLHTAGQIAEQFCGLGRPSHHTFAEARHVARAARLMKEK